MGLLSLKQWKHLRGDITGGLTAAIVALPLALAFGIASGAGPLAGLYGSILGGLVAGLFGGCGVQITGPTGAMTAVLVRVSSQYGLGGMLLAGALAGLMQIIFGLLRLGAFVKFLPRPVISGFTNGVSILFFMTAIGDALETPSITLITIAGILIASRLLKRIPDSLVGLIIGLTANQLFIGSPHVVGNIDLQLPTFSLGSMPFDQLTNLLLPAFTICLLGSISALLSAEVTDEMIGIKHDSNRELIGQGLGNLVATLFGGIPVSGAVVRSAANINSGGRTRLSSVLHSIFLLLMVLLLAPIVKQIPLASLAAILMVASMRTADRKGLRLIPRVRWSYGAIVILTTVLTVVKDLTAGVAVGLLFAGAVALVELARSPEGKSVELPALFTKRRKIKIIALHGPLFFVGIENLRRKINDAADAEILVCDLSSVTAIDESGAFALGDLVRRHRKAGREIYLRGMGEKHIQMLTDMGVIESLDCLRIPPEISGIIDEALDNDSHEQQFNQLELA